MTRKQGLVLALTLAVTWLNGLAYAKGSVTRYEARMQSEKVGALVQILMVKHADELPCHENNLAWLRGKGPGRKSYRVVVSCFGGQSRIDVLTDKDLTGEFVVTEGLHVGYDIFYKPALPNPVENWRTIAESVAHVHSSDVLAAVRRANILIAQRRENQALERLRRNLAGGFSP